MNRHVCAMALVALMAAGMVRAAEGTWDWTTATPESQGMSSPALEKAWAELKARSTTGFLVIRNDRVVFERYAAEWDRHKPHGTASMAKALVGGTSLMVAMSDGKIRPDDLAGKFVPQWRDVPRKKDITIRHLATHTSGIEDAEQDDLAHDKLTGWKGDFWKRLAVPNDPFTIARDVAPVLFAPGTKEHYSNPGMAMLGYCITAAIKGSPDEDLRSLLKHRVMDPIGAAEKEWSVGYGKPVLVDGLAVIAPWGGGSYSADATARVGRLMMRGGDWQGKQFLDPDVVRTATTFAGMPNRTGLGWWVNHNPDGTKAWKDAPEDAFSGSGAGQQFLMVVPSLNLIIVRNGAMMDTTLSHHAGLERYVIGPVIKAVTGQGQAPYPPSQVITGITWAPRESIVRQAQDSDNWPLTWGDDDNQYTAWGDGHGFAPMIKEKLSLGFSRVNGRAEHFAGVNIRSASGEQTGNGAKGKKASGMLMVDRVLYMWVRNAANSQLAWSEDHGQTWNWAEWKFTSGFGCPTFLNFGKNYAGARDEFVYIYSHDSDSAYLPADRMVLARVPTNRIGNRDAYEFFAGSGDGGRPAWSKEIAQRGAVFSHSGKCYRSGISYNASLKRYLWCQTLPGRDARFAGGFGIYDAPEPWGPWTTVYYTEQWDVGPGDTCSFPTKWMSEDAAYLVFSGEDSFSVRKATFVGRAAIETPKAAAALSAVKSGDTIAIASQGGALTYKAVVDGKRGGDITQFSLPADGPVVARELNDVFYHGTHNKEYTLRGWTGRDRCNLSCSLELVSQKPDEVVVRVNLLATGTYKVLAQDPAAQAKIRKTHVSYKDKTVEIKRTYTFKPDRVVLNDELLWLQPDTQPTTVYFTPAFEPRSVQGPVRLINGATTAGFNVTTSGGRKIPAPIAYPSTAENFLKNGYKVSVRTTATSFDLAKSELYFYEKPWQQDWFQLSGFMYRVAGNPAGKPIGMTHEVAFSKAAVSEMPPVVTIQSPPWDARWLDEKGEVPKFKIGDTVKLAATAVNSDGTRVPDQDISWEIHIDPWWNTPAVTLPGGHTSYTLPEVANEQDKAIAKDRQLLAVISIKVKGKNGTEAVEPFAMLVGRSSE